MESLSSAFSMDGGWVMDLVMVDNGRFVNTQSRSRDERRSGNDGVFDLCARAIAWAKRRSCLPTGRFGSPNEISKHEIRRVGNEDTLIVESTA